MVLNAKLLQLIVVVEVLAQVSEVTVGADSGCLHVVDLVTELKVLLALGSQLVAVVLVPSQSVLLVILLVRMHLIADVREDVSTVDGKLPVLVLVVLGLLEGATKLGVLLFQILGLLCGRVKLVVSST